ncbi:hypothetical protein L3V43_22540 [Pseudoalteromonas sp. L23]|uniref:hypothetical protein n=1 Tax=unclassified Pseudoalteromonas TaxID=194690 RepID=UPI001F371870|nr:MULTISPECIES: hypothetical protein [unclassified Pseudoalteromonas]MCF2828619.1 hypothetical protein [Pseudoalteromonas sp. OF5H-5]MCF2832579.1 hypothetical protein [Pseudoalteromonas sp. DL2-H6]MCF2924777.1 hypothetical protein [Pseudoalteromonas sp. DL2-H1]MCF7516381.1 hypothetical protein [Pseudoalteromonas sp. L7]MCF7528428.1 hypothetical protein [Pseudoalteromonas sp. L23]
MTLVVAGYNFDQNPWRSIDNIKENTGIRQEGLFAIADSIITSLSSNGHSPLLSGFKKIKEIPVKLWQPYFIGENFKSYNNVFLQFECFVAFAGSTLTAQHVIDLISNHLATLRIDFQSGNFETDGKYVVKKICDSNNLIKNARSSVYGDDMFIPEKHYRGILTAEYIAEVVEHSINKALSSAQKHKLDENSLKEMYTEFILGVNCPSSKSDLLIKYTMKQRITLEGMIEVYVVGEKIQEGDVAVIGMTSRFGDLAQDAAKSAIENGLSLKSEMTSFVKKAISEVNAEGSFQIAMPVVVKSLKSRRITKQVIAEET